jgi:hypothetical protein
MKVTRIAILLALLLSLQTLAAHAQESDEEITLKLNRDMGYGGFGQIQGTFSMRVTGPDDLDYVEFMIDDELIGTVYEPPFNLQFRTGSFEPGLRTMWAVGFIEGGAELRSNDIRQEFLSGEEAGQATLKLVVPILVVVVGLSIAGVLFPLLLRKRGGQFQIGEYGAAGGTVCRKCDLPFSRNVLSPNLVFGKLERCPHCGKWAILSRANTSELEAAEERLRADTRKGVMKSEESEEDQLRRMVDESRFED